MNIPKSRCPHITVIGDYTKEDIIRKQESPCDTCNVGGQYYWVCLHKNCLYVGCNDAGNNHCIKHFQTMNTHSLFLNLTSLQVYCLLCECEVFLENNEPPIPGMLPPHPLINKTDTDSEEDLDINDDNIKPRGLTGLQNLGNTCYMNSAIQALSNCPQLTNFFLDCGPFIPSENKPGLARSYMRLMKEMWHKKRPSYVVPSGIAYGIKIVCPVFRGYSQQDAQEFLRCFMDQLHEELKEPYIESQSISPISPVSNECFDYTLGDSGVAPSEDSSQSDVEYETCDSIASSDKGSCEDEGIESQDNTESNEQPNSFSSCPAKYIFPSAPSEIQPTVHNSNILNPQENPNASQTEHLSSLTNITTQQIIDKFDVQLQNKNLHAENAEKSKNSIECGNICKMKQSNALIIHSTSRQSWERGYANANKASHLNSVEPDSMSNSTFDQKKTKQFRSIVSDTFDGKILSSVQCLTCNTVSTTKETFQDLSLPIPNRDHLHMIHAAQGNHKSGGTCTDAYSHQGWFSALFGWVISWFWGPTVNLQDCLSAFFSADELKGDNMYSCEKCKKLRNGIKYSKVIELPEVLCIHLKRFRHEIMFSSKISNFVSFPLEGLDMSTFLHKTHPQGNITYDLTSVICHHGTAGSGHYTSYCLNYLNDQWYEFDDQYVTAVDAEMVRHCEAYVLFYRKCGGEMIKKRLCAVELMERCRSEQGLLKFHISKQWINRFNNFADPGPITNTDFLCIHGGVPPQKAAYAEDLCTILPQSVWEYLHETFSGGPSCTHLYICPLCQADVDNLNLKRKKELKEFLSLNATFQDFEGPSIVFAISMNWFRRWESFTCRDCDPPGPIDNTNICTLKNNQAVLKLGSDYCSISKEMYQYLHSIYGGGPDIAMQLNFKSITCHYPPFSISNDCCDSQKAVIKSHLSVQNTPVDSNLNCCASSQNYHQLYSFENAIPTDAENEQSQEFISSKETQSDSISLALKRTKL